MSRVEKLSSVSTVIGIICRNTKRHLIVRRPCCSSVWVYHNNSLNQIDNAVKFIARKLGRIGSQPMTVNFCILTKPEPKMSSSIINIDGNDASFTVLKIEHPPMSTRKYREDWNIMLD